MQELRLVAVSEDGSYVILTQPGRGTRFSLPNDERLRAVARGQFSRLAQYEIEVESPLRPKEIQARIRAGETAEQIADTAGVPLDRIRWFEGPVLAERAYVAQQAMNASVRRPGDSGPGPRLGEIVAERLRAVGDDPEDAEWDSVKRGDGSWLVQLAPSAGGRHERACWVFDAKRRHAVPDDDEASRLSLPADVLAETGLEAAPAPRTGNVTPFVPRSVPSHEPSPGPDTEQERRPAPGTRAAGGAGPGGSPALRHPGLPRQSAPAADLPRPQEPAEGDSGSPAATSPAREEHAAAGPGTRAAAGDASAAADDPGAAASKEGAGQAGQAAARTQASDEVPARSAEGQDQATAAEGQGRQAAASGRGGRRGRIRRSSVPSWDEIMFGDSRRQD